MNYTDRKLQLIFAKDVARHANHDPRLFFQAKAAVIPKARAKEGKATRKFNRNLKYAHGSNLCFPPFRTGPTLVVRPSLRRPEDCGNAGK